MAPVPKTVARPLTSDRPADCSICRCWIEAARPGERHLTILQLPRHWRSKPRPCPGNPFRTDMSPRFRRLTFGSAITSSLEATF